MKNQRVQTTLRFYLLLASFVAAAWVLGGLCVTPAGAATTHDHTQRPFPETVKVSDWAKGEVLRSVELGFGPTGDYGVPDSLSEPICRGDFCLHTAQFIAAQQGCDEASLSAVICHYNGELNSAGYPVPAFSDAWGWDSISALHYLGIVQGRGEDYFDFGSEITRQEAAALLSRTYQAYGGSLPEAAGSLSFTDRADIAPWAENSVAAVAALGIMKGYEDGRFAPNDPYSYEQCLITLVRMYENLPISRKNGNVAPLYTYEQYLQMIDDQDRMGKESGGGRMKRQVAEGPVAAFVEQETYGASNSATLPKLVYRSGAMRAIDDLGVCDTGRGWLSPRTDIIDPHFSDDGKTFFCVITLAGDVADYSAQYPGSVWHGHRAGTYQVTIDVETLAVRADKL